MVSGGLLVSCFHGAHHLVAPTFGIYLIKSASTIRLNPHGIPLPPANTSGAAGGLPNANEVQACKSCYFDLPMPDLIMFIQCATPNNPKAGPRTTAAQVTYHELYELDANPGGSNTTQTDDLRSNTV